jgi:hypothetical protein
MGVSAVRAAESATVQCIHLDNLNFQHCLIIARNDPNIDKNGALCLLNALACIDRRICIKPSQKTFRTKRILAKAARQNR